MASNPFACHPELPEELRGLPIVGVNIVHNGPPFKLEPLPGEEIRHGSSGMVYRIENPLFHTIVGHPQFVACKEIEATSREDLRAIRSEVEILMKMGNVSGCVRLNTVHYRPFDGGGRMFLVMEPWAELSLQAVIMSLVGKSKLSSDRFAELTPWLTENPLRYWPNFMWMSLSFLASMTREPMLPFGNPSINPLGTVLMRNGDVVSYTPEDGGNILRPTILARGWLKNTGFSLWEHVRHRDIKPDNILISFKSKPSFPRSSGLEPVFVDFGISRLHDEDLTTSHTGTDAYQAPEQHPGTPPSLKSDTWSLGCCFTFIEALIHSGAHGVTQIHRIAVERNKRFRDNVQQVNEFLGSPPTRDLTTTEEKLRLALRTIVKEHMLVAEADRLHPIRLLKLLEEALPDCPLP